MIDCNDPPVARMPMNPATAPVSLQGASVVVTRPAATAAALVRAARARAAHVVRLPGLELRAIGSAAVAIAALQTTVDDDALIFTSPAAVRFAFGLGSFGLPARVFAVGAGTARALARRGIVAICPVGRQDSEGVLAIDALADVLGWRVTIVDAPGGRDALAPALTARGAQVRRIAVYERVAPRLANRHFRDLEQAPTPWLSLLSSTEAMSHLLALLPSGLAVRWRAQPLIVSSVRLRDVAEAAGFEQIWVARSAMPVDLLDCAAAGWARIA